jgi:hypothetical protein
MDKFKNYYIPMKVWNNFNSYPKKKKKELISEDQKIETKSIDKIS